MNSLVARRLQTLACVKSTATTTTSRRSLAGIRDWFGKKDKSGSEQIEAAEQSVIDSLKSSSANNELASNDYEAIRKTE